MIWKGLHCALMGSGMPHRTGWVWEQRLVLERTIPYAGTFFGIGTMLLEFGTAHYRN